MNFISAVIVRHGGRVIHSIFGPGHWGSVELDRQKFLELTKPQLCILESVMVSALELACFKFEKRKIQEPPAKPSSSAKLSPSDLFSSLLGSMVEVRAQDGIQVQGRLIYAEHTHGHKGFGNLIIEGEHGRILVRGPGVIAVLKR